MSTFRKHDLSLGDQTHRINKLRSSNNVRPRFPRFFGLPTFCKYKDTFFCLWFCVVSRKCYTTLGDRYAILHLRFDDKLICSIGRRNLHSLQDRKHVVKSCHKNRLRDARGGQQLHLPVSFSPFRKYLSELLKLFSLPWRLELFSTESALPALIGELSIVDDWSRNVG